MRYELYEFFHNKRNVGCEFINYMGESDNLKALERQAADDRADYCILDNETARIKDSSEKADADDYETTVRGCKFAKAFYDAMRDVDLDYIAKYNEKYNQAKIAAKQESEKFLHKKRKPDR